MKNILIILLIILIITNRNGVITGSINAFNIWSNTLLPSLFPIFILSDLILSSKLIMKICLYIGKLFTYIFKTSNYSFYIFIISVLCGTPTNAKNLYSLYKNNLIEEKDITKILSFTYYFNPLFMLTFINIKCILIFYISNLITGFILRNTYINNSINNNISIIKFNLNDSIDKSMHILLNILGTLIVFASLIYSIPFINEYINIIISILLETTTAMYKIKLYFDINYLYLIALSIGGLSMLIQIKSIMKDTFIDYKYLIISRILTMIISILISSTT